MWSPWWPLQFNVARILKECRGKMMERVLCFRWAPGALNCYLLDNPAPVAGFTSQFAWFLVHLVEEENKENVILRQYGVIIDSHSEKGIHRRVEFCCFVFACIFFKQTCYPIKSKPIYIL